MIVYVVLAALMLYGIWMSTHLWTHKHRREAILLGVISIVTECYLLPEIGDWMPTTEKINTWLYQSLSNFVERQAHVVQEVHPS